MSRYRKKPVVIDAMQFTSANGNEVMDWIEAVAPGVVRETFALQSGTIVIATLEGDMTAGPGDWIIRGIKGEFYSCRDDIFRATYEPAD